MADPTDPFPLAAMLRRAVEHARRDGRSQADIARAAGLEPPNLTRALDPAHGTRPDVARRILRACGCSVQLVFSD